MTTLPRPVKGAHSDLELRLRDLRERMGRAAGRSGRAPDRVRLVGITKGVAADRVRAAVALGVLDLGENRVQEAEAKIPEVAAASEGVRLTWHLVGHLQRNKAARAVRWFDRIHGVDGIEIAAALSRHAASAGREPAVMIEVNVAGAASQHGVAPAGLAELARAVAKLPALRLDGLMTVGPEVPRAEDARPRFARLRELRDEVERATGLALPELSMGMSADFEVAIEEGSTMVRVGRALFGERPIGG